MRFSTNSKPPSLLPPDICGLDEVLAVSRALSLTLRFVFWLSGAGSADVGGTPFEFESQVVIWGSLNGG